MTTKNLISACLTLMILFISVHSKKPWPALPLLMSHLRFGNQCSKSACSCEDLKTHYCEKNEWCLKNKNQTADCLLKEVAEEEKTFELVSPRSTGSATRGLEGLVKTPSAHEKTFI